MSPAQRRQIVDREHPNLPIVRQCALLGVSRSSLYYRPRAASAEDLSLMGEIDRQYLETPFYGSRRMRAWLERQGMPDQNPPAVDRQAHHERKETVRPEPVEGRAQD